MPHIIIEYAADRGIAAMELVKNAHKAAVESGLFGVKDIKTRAHAVRDYIVGEGQDGFVHVRAYLLEGRTLEQKQGLSEALVEALGSLMASGDQLTVDVRELAKDTYRKRIL